MSTISIHSSQDQFPITLDPEATPVDLIRNLDTFILGDTVHLEAGNLSKSEKIKQAVCIIDAAVDSEFKNYSLIHSFLIQTVEGLNSNSIERVVIEMRRRFTALSDHCYFYDDFLRQFIPLLKKLESPKKVYETADLLFQKLLRAPEKDSDSLLNFYSAIQKIIPEEARYSLLIRIMKGTKIHFFRRGNIVLQQAAREFSKSQQLDLARHLIQNFWFYVNRCTNWITYFLKDHLKDLDDATIQEYATQVIARPYDRDRFMTEYESLTDRQKLILARCYHEKYLKEPMRAVQFKGGRPFLFTSSIFVAAAHEEINLLSKINSADKNIFVREIIERCGPHSYYPEVLKINCSALSVVTDDEAQWKLFRQLQEYVFKKYEEKRGSLDKYGKPYLLAKDREEYLMMLYRLYSALTIKNKFQFFYPSLTSLEIDGPQDFEESFYQKIEDYSIALGINILDVFLRYTTLHMQFSDYGQGYSFIHALIKHYFGTSSEAEADFNRKKNEAPNLQKNYEQAFFKNAEEFLQSQNGDSQIVPIRQGRSFLYPLNDDEYLVIKYVNEENKKGKLLIRELLWVQAIQKLKAQGKINFLSEMIEPVVGKRGLPLQLEINGVEAIAFRTNKKYYQDIMADDVSKDDFFQGLGISLHDFFELAKQGIYHTAPLVLFHNKRDGEKRGDGLSDDGRYVWSPGVVFEGARRTLMGMLENYPAALRHKNIGNGLRDLEELATLDEIVSQGKVWAPGLRDLKKRNEAYPRLNKNALYDPLMAGTAVFSASLMIGERNARENNYDIHLWKNEEKLEAWGEELLAVHALAYGVKFGFDYWQSVEDLSDKIDWTKYARQQAFFMTKAYIPYVRQNKGFAIFGRRKPMDWSLIYGKETYVSFGKYYSRIDVNGKETQVSTFDPEHGFIGFNKNPAEKSLGPWNGNNPIQLMEKATWVSQINWNEYHQKRADTDEIWKRNLSPQKMQQRRAMPLHQRFAGLLNKH